MIKHNKPSVYHAMVFFLSLISFSAFSQTYLMQSGTSINTTCSGTVFDIGGSSGAYNSNIDDTITFIPATPGSRINLDFSAYTFSTESNYDFVYVYDGNSVKAPLIGKFSGSVNPGVLYSTSPTGALTIYFHSDYGVNKEGFGADVSCLSSVALSDLSLNLPDHTPINSTAGTPFSISASVTNTGSYKATSSKVSYFLSTNTSLEAEDIFLGYSTDAALSSGSTLVKTTSLTIPVATKAGNYNILLVADYEDLISETDETNNIQSINITVLEPLIDLALSNPAVSLTSLPAGASTTVTSAITNTGNNPTPVSSVTYYLSSDNIYDPSDVQVGITNGTVLAAGASASRNGSITIPAETSVGDYYLIYFIDASNDVPETDETNNINSLSITIIPTVIDLIVSSPSISPETLIIGNTATLSCTIKNTGNASATSSTVGYYLSTDQIFDASDVFLAEASGGTITAGSSASRSISGTIPVTTPAGLYYIICYGDHLNTVLETDESNNYLSSPVTVIEPFKDFTISSLIAPTTANQYDEFSISCKINNVGNVSANPSNVAFYLSTDIFFNEDDILLGTETGSVLENGLNSTRYIIAKIPGTTIPGSYFILCIADPANLVSESDETNNVSWQAITINEAAIDLTVTAPTGSIIGGPGLPIFVGATINNKGNTKINTDLGFFLSLDNIYDSDDILIGNTSASIHINDVNVKSITATIPPGTALGSYYILSVADYNNSIKETNESNNYIAKSITIDNNYLVPTSGSTSITTCSGYIFDDGGIIDNYSNNVSSTLTLHPGIAGNKIRMDFNIQTFFLTSGDLLRIYDGISTSAPLIGTYAAHNPGIVFATSESGAITLQLVSNASVTATGFGAKISCVKTVPNVDLHFTSASCPATAIAGENIYINHTLQNQGWTDSPKYQINYFLSIDEKYDASDVSLGFLSSFTNTILAKGQSVYHDNSLSVSSSTLSGDYYILFYVDFYDDLIESDETNNLQARPIKIIGSSIDLQISTTTAPATATSGTSITLGSTITNSGGSKSKQTSVIMYLSTDNTYDASDRALAVASVSAINAGTSIAASSETGYIPINITGSYYIIYKIEFTNGTNTTVNFASKAITINSPNLDLTVSSPTAPATAVTGSTISLTCLVVNTGTVAASKSDLAYYLSTDEIFDPSDILLGTSLNNTLAAGATSARTTTCTIPYNANSGNKFILFVADYANAIAEMNETNNVVSMPINITLADIDLTILSPVASSNPQAGQTIYVNSVVKNIGTATSKTVTLGYYLSKDSLYDINDIFIGSGSTYQTVIGGTSIKVQTQVTIPDATIPGAYYLIYFADYSEMITETNETNNIVSIATTIKPSNADLIISSQTAPASALAGQTISLSCTIKNIGTSYSPSSNVGYYLSSDNIYDLNDILLATSNGAVLPTTSDRTANATIPSTTAPGNYYILFVADHTNALSEINENNNYSSLPIDISILTGLKLASDFSLEVYPNPTTDYFTLDLSNSSFESRIHVKLVNELGITVMKEEIESKNPYTFHTNGYSKGTYILLIEVDGRLKTKKIVVQ
jgi:subtilase family serine protease